MINHPTRSLLYRGVHDAMDSANNGHVFPGGKTRKVITKFDGTITYNGQFTLGQTTANAARAHQLETGTYDALCISTSRSLHTASQFATAGNSSSGWVYVIDEALLPLHGISTEEFQDAEHPEECEVTLIPQSYGPLPLEVIVDKLRVNSRGELPD